MANGVPKDLSQSDDIGCVTPRSWRIVACVFLLCVFLLSVGGNALVCLLLCWKRTLRSKASLFVVNLMVCDLFSALFAIPMEFVFIVGEEQWLLGEPGYFFSMGIFVCFLTMSFLNITAVTLERFVAIKYPFKYLAWVTRNKITAIILFVWFYSITISVLVSFTLNPEKYDFIIPDLYYYPFLTIHVLIPTALVTLIYLKLLRIARLQRNRIRAQPAAPANSTNREKSSRFGQNLKAAKTVGVFFTLLVLAWLPFCVVQFLKFSDIGHCSWDLADTLSLCVTYSNGALNVLVYWWRDEQFRRNIRKIIICLPENDENFHSTIIRQNTSGQL